MSTYRTFLCLVLAFALIPVFNAYADSKKNTKPAIYQMAEIMHRLKHYPSPLGLDVLKKIIESADATDNERTIATAMTNLQHKVADSDIPKLEAIIANSGSTPYERDLAKIVLNLDHRPTKEDKTTLKAMMK